MKCLFSTGIIQPYESTLKILMLLLEVIVILNTIILRVNGFIKQAFEMLSYLNVFLSTQLSQRLRALEVLPLPTECFFTGVELVTKIFELPLLQKLALALLKLCLFLSALLKDGLMTKSTLACQGLCVSCAFVLIIL